MRRRINRHDLTDDTMCPHLALNEYGGELTLDDLPPFALYDELLWTELESARARLREVEARVVVAMREESFDAIEIESGRKLWYIRNGRIIRRGGVGASRSSS